MIAVDSNILVYAHRRDSPWYNAASACVADLAQGRAAWTIPWPCIHEFFSTVTHPKIYKPCSTFEQTITQIDYWLASPSLSLLAESEGYWSILRAAIRDGRVTGGLVHDARIAAICEFHGVTELWSADRDFSRFPKLKIRNPLVR